MPEELEIENVTDGWQLKRTNEFRVRRRLSFFPWIVVSGFDTDYHWTGKWLKFVKIKEQKCLERFEKFDDGWTYQNYWSEWKEKWRLVEILE